MIARKDWTRWSALLDEALDLDADARPQWLAALAMRDADAASAVQRLLARDVDDLSSTVDGLMRFDGGNASRQHFESALLTILTQDESADAAQPGQSFGPWQVSRKLGSGGMGEVWLAERADALYHGEAAIKLLRATGEATRLTARFSRERQALARLAHPGIARLLDAGVQHQQPYLVLEYVRGTPLPDYVQAHASTLTQCVQLALAIGRAVEYAHGRLIVHRDLKPSNVLVTADGEVKLLDFGIASLIDDEHSKETSLTGLYGRGLTLDYAAPEQITGEHTGVGADVFSLGVMLFELLTGERPFKPNKPGRTALEYAVLHQAAPRLSQRAKDIPVSLDAVLAKALQKSPEDRYPTMAAFVADLERWLEHRPVLAAQRDWRRDTALWLRRNRLVAGLSLAVILSLAGGLAASQWQSRRLQIEARKSQAVQNFLVSLLEATDISVGSAQSRSLRGVLDAGRARIDTELAQQPEVQATLYKVLGKGYFAQSEAAIAEVLYRKALPLTAQHYGRASAEYADLLIDLGDSIYEFGRYDEACGYYSEAEALIPQLPQGHEELVINTLNNLSACKAQAGEVHVAVTLRERALSLSLADGKPVTEEQSGLISDYGLSLLRAGRLAEAEQQFRRSIAAKAQRRQNLNYAITANLLGETLIAEGRYAEAAALEAETEAIIRASGGDTLTLAFALRNRARRLYEQGDTAAALPVIQSALSTLESKVGAEAPNAVQMQSLQAQMLASDAQRDVALVLASKAFERLKGKAPLIRGRVHIALGAVQVMTGHDAEAIDTLRAAIADQSAMLGAEHLTVGSAKAWLGIAQRHLKRAEAAFTLTEADRILALQMQPQQVLRQMVLRELERQP